ncbi:DUF2145 domain-containing protein [Ramlibacter tataouinensis]|uniref:DUF2145 domain-containing protein n=1 Tax=Ramlibacter tataouinensis TaxID=94132 RepID=UPI0022F3888C|nr:DUF2145 domain-containing protein [Ramlibacter tataouinensis]WBY00189.1 DUF2145 domain-containing protein [Ramlibacter tataouinensis]
MRTAPLLRGALAALVAFLLLAGTAAHAGRSCETRKLTPQALERGLELAERTRQVLEAEHERTGLQVVVLARAGQDLSKYGLRWSHLGFAYREATPARPVWRVVHKLNHCGTADGALYRQGLGEFFLDDLWRQQAAWSPLPPALQAGLLPVLRDDARLAALHHKPYSMVSYAWGSRYQQSNQWAIETLALAQPQAVSGRAQAQAWLAAQGYQPTVLKLGPLTRLGGRMTAANIAFDDHPDAKRFSDRIETVTADSVFAWLPRAGLGAAPRTLQLD